MNKITIGARGSKLSLAYVSKVKSLILKDSINTDIHIKTIKTSGDIHQNIKISEIGGKNLFCKEIEENLIKNNIDIAVHSLKDMESIEHKDLIDGFDISARSRWPLDEDATYMKGPGLKL